MKIIFFTITFCAGICFSGNAQKAKDPQSAWLIKPSLAFQMPGGHMADMYNSNFSTGLGVGYKTASNWTFSIDGQYLFSDDIKDPDQLLNPILTEKGFILNSIGNYAQVSVLERGFYLTGDISKTLDFLKINPNSGFDLLLGAGYMMHWVEIKNAGNDSPQILGEYQKGYDHLSGGLLLKESIGYTYLSNNRRINFRLSFEIMEGFTQSLRDFSYSTGKPIESNKLDLLYGIRLEWILPIYKGGGKDAYYYD